MPGTVTGEHEIKSKPSQEDQKITSKAQGSPDLLSSCVHQGHLAAFGSPGFSTARECPEQLPESTRLRANPHKRIKRSRAKPKALLIFCPLVCTRGTWPRSARQVSRLPGNARNSYRRARD